MVPRNACSWQLKKADVRARAAKMWDHEWTLPEGVLIDSHALNSSVNSSLRNRASGTVKGFSCFMTSNEVFRGCLFVRICYLILSHLAFLHAETVHSAPMLLNTSSPSAEELAAGAPVSVSVCAPVSVSGSPPPAHLQPTICQTWT